MKPIFCFVEVSPARSLRSFDNSAEFCLAQLYYVKFVKIESRKKNLHSIVVDIQFNTKTEQERQE